MRIQKMLKGIVSRRKAEEYIKAGRVQINGKTAEIGTIIDPEHDKITLDGKTVAPPRELVYIMLHKPKGVITSAHDPQGRKTVLDLLSADKDLTKIIKTRIFPVGRLDYDTSGLLILTNDGDFAQRLAHPGHETKKTYIARVRGVPSEEALNLLREGIMLEGKKTAPCEILPTQKRAYTELRMTLYEGRNRQVRKMCEAIKHPATALKRIAVGALKLDTLPVGAWRLLSAQEVNKLG
jgi:23S rRNA pseudouridine2605 synthase